MYCAVRGIFNVEFISIDVVYTIPLQTTAGMWITLVAYMGHIPYYSRMNTSKYKSVVVDKLTYDIIRNLSVGNKNTSIASTTKRYVLAGLESEEFYANIDCELTEGGTRRLKRLLGDLEWFRIHAGVFLNDKQLKKTKKRYIIDTEESRALDIVMETVFDCGG